MGTFRKVLWGVSLFVLSSFLNAEMPRGYVCYRCDGIVIDGELTETEWGKAKWTDHFVDIEGDKKPSPTFATRVKMLWDDNYFYFAAEMEEPHIWATLTKRDSVIFHDNDFEIFIDPDGDNHNYYEFEQNAFNTVWDLFLVKPYRDGGPPLNGWDIAGLKSAVKIYGTLNDPSDQDDKWTVEVAIPWQILKEAATQSRRPKDGESWRVNFSRVNWDMEIVDGKYVKKKDLATGKNLPEHNWVWSPQGVIAMHQPETWGYVQFSDLKVGNGQVAFKPDKHYALKKSLMRFYEIQKRYHKKHKRFAKSWSELKLADVPFGLFCTGYQFEIHGKANDGTVWVVNNEGRLFKRGCKK